MGSPRPRRPAPSTCFPTARPPPTTCSRRSSPRAATASCSTATSSPTGASRPTVRTPGRSRSFGPRLDYVVAPGRAPTAIGALTAITGRHRVPPRWAIGPILDRLVEFPSDTPATPRGRDHATTSRISTATMLPLDAYRIEGWQFLDDAVLARLIGELRGAGSSRCSTSAPSSARTTIGTDDPAAYDEAVGARLRRHPRRRLARTCSPPTSTPTARADRLHEPGGGALVEGRESPGRSSSAPRASCRTSASRSQVDMHFDDGSTGATMHNRLPVLFHRATMAAVRDFERAHPRRKLFYFTRTGYSGSPGRRATSRQLPRRRDDRLDATRPAWPR